MKKELLQKVEEPKMLWVLPKRAQALVDRMEEIRTENVRVHSAYGDFVITDEFNIFSYRFSSKGKVLNTFGPYSLPWHHPEDYFIYGLPKHLRDQMLPGRGLRDVTDRYTHSLEYWNKFAKAIGYSSVYEFFWVLDQINDDWQFHTSRTIVRIYCRDNQHIEAVSKSLGYSSFASLVKNIETLGVASVTSSFDFDRPDVQSESIRIRLRNFL